MSIFDAFVLSGLTVQIIAGFILSVEVIGLDRVARWMKSLSLLRGDLIDEGKGYAVSSRVYRVMRFIRGVSAIMGVIITLYLSKRYFIDPQHLHVNQRTYVLLIGGLVGGFLGVIVHRGAVHGVGAAVFALRKLETQTHARSSGIIGFLLLFLGFVLQFAGTLGQVLSK